MAAVTITDPRAAADGSNNSHGGFVAAGASATSSSVGSIIEGTTVARWGQGGVLVIKFALSLLQTATNAGTAVYYVGWGTSVSTSFVGIRINRSTGTTVNVAWFVRGGTAAGLDLTFTPMLTADAIYSLSIEYGFSSAGDMRFALLLTDADGNKLAAANTAASAVNAPLVSEQPTLRCQVTNGSNDGNARTISLFHASRWTSRAPL